MFGLTAVPVTACAFAALQSEEEEEEEDKSVGFRCLAFIAANSITCFLCFQQ